MSREYQTLPSFLFQGHGQDPVPAPSPQHYPFGLMWDGQLERLFYSLVLFPESAAPNQPKL